MRSLATAVEELLLAPRGPCSCRYRRPDIMPAPETNDSISPARSGSRWSAFAPVELGVLSTTYSRFISPASGLRRLAKSRRVAGEAGEAAYRKSASSERITSAFPEVVLRFDRLAECQLCAFEDVVAVDRLIHVPLGLRIDLEQRLQLVGKRRRGNRRRQNADACPLQAFLNTERRPHGLDETIPRSECRPGRSGSASGQGRTCPGSRPGRKYRCRRDWPDACRYPQSWSDDTDGSQPESDWRIRPE